MSFQSSKLLALIVISHIFMSVPCNVVLMLSQLDHELFRLKTSHCIEDPTKMIVVNICHMLYVANYAINFLLYCLGNKDVRKETVSLLKDWRQAGRGAFSRVSRRAKEMGLMNTRDWAVSTTFKRSSSTKN